MRRLQGTDQEFVNPTVLKCLPTPEPATSGIARIEVSTSAAIIFLSSFSGIGSRHASFFHELTTLRGSEMDEFCP
jgi:hypothetical protein